MPGRGAGHRGRHFCAGADLGRGGAPGERVESSRRLYREAVRLFGVPIPVVAAVRGAAVGGGLGLACAADFRVTAPGARFHANFAALGFHQGFGLSATLPRLVGAQPAAELLYTARKVDGEQAVALGLADRLADDPADDGDPLPAALAPATEIAAAAPLAADPFRPPRARPPGSGPAGPARPAAPGPVVTTGNRVPVVARTSRIALETSGPTTNPAGCGRRVRAGTRGSRNATTTSARAWAPTAGRSGTGRRAGTRRPPGRAGRAVTPERVVGPRPGVASSVPPQRMPIARPRP